MPSKNTDAQNNWLYATNILITDSDTKVRHELRAVRDALFDEDGNFMWDRPTNDFSDGSMVKSPTMYSDSDTWVSNDESHITSVDELAPWEIELMRDIYEGYRSPNRVELDDIAFTYSSVWNWVVTVDGKSHSDSNWSFTTNVDSARQAAEYALWPNRVELDDILLASTWTKDSPDGASFVWFKENDAYYTGYSDHVVNACIRSDEEWLEIRTNWEEYYWPERIHQSDINFIGMMTNRLGASESVVFTNQGNWWATSTHIPQTRPSHNTRDACENYRWPNRVSMDNILGWRAKNHNHVYLATNDGNHPNNVNIYCHITDKEF